MLVQDDDPVDPVDPVDPNAETADPNAEPADPNGEPGEDKGGESGWKHRIDRLTRDRDTVKDKLEERESELNAIRDEAKALRETVETTGVLEACTASGVLPELIPSAEDRGVLAEAHVLAANKKFWRRQERLNEFEYRGKTMTGDEAREKADECEDRLEKIRSRAARVADRFQQEHKELLALGRAARKAGWKQPAKGSNETQRRGDDDVPRGGKKPAMAVVPKPGNKKIDWSKVKSAEEFEDLQAQQLRR